VAGNTTLDFEGCSLYVNSPGAGALTLNGGAAVNAASAYIVGTVSGSGLTTTQGTYTGTDPLIDPYLTAAVPAYSGCSANNYKLTSGQTDSKTAGASGIFVFCNGLALNGGSSLSLGP